MGILTYTEAVPGLSSIIVRTAYFMLQEWCFVARSGKNSLTGLNP